MSFNNCGNTDNLNLTFHFPEAKEAMFVSSIYREEKNKGGSTAFVKAALPMVAILLMCGTVLLLTGNIPELRKSLLKMLAFPCVILALFPLWEIIKGIHLSGIIKKVNDGSFMLAEVQFVDKKASRAYYKQISNDRFHYYVTVSDDYGNKAKLKTCRMVYESSDPENKLYLIQFVSKRGYWNKLDLYSSGVSSPANIFSMHFSRK